LTRTFAARKLGIALCLRLHLCLLIVALHLRLVAVDEQPRHHPGGHHGHRGDARLLVLGVVDVHLRLDRGLSHDDTVA
jgi:hypothetical protein